MSLTDDAASPRWRRVLLRTVPFVRPAAAVLISAAIAYAVVSQWSGVSTVLVTLAWQHVTLSFVAALGGTLFSVMAWRAILAGEGHRVSPPVAGRIFLVGQLGKYLPGSVWAVVLQMELGKAAGIPRARAFTTSLTWVGLSLSTALLTGVLAFPVLVSSHPWEVWSLLALLPLALVASSPPVLTRLVNLLLRLMRKSPLPAPLTWRGVLSAMAWLIGGWVLYGVHLWLLASAVGAPGLGGLTRCIGGFALAVAAGVIFVLAPSGAGVREALIVAALAPVLTTGEALGVAVVSRGVFIVVDVCAAGVAALVGTKKVRAALATGEAAVQAKAKVRALT